MRNSLLLFSTIFPSIALAHETHGHTFVENLWHVLSSPEHAWPLTLALVIAGLVAFVKRRR